MLGMVQKQDSQVNDPFSSLGSAMLPNSGKDCCNTAMSMQTAINALSEHSRGNSFSDDSPFYLGSGEYLYKVDFVQITNLCPFKSKVS